MNFDQPAMISDCDGCGRRHLSIEQWVSCLISKLEATRAQLRAALQHPDRALGRRVREIREQFEAMPMTRGGAFEERRLAGTKRGKR